VDTIKTKSLAQQADLRPSDRRERKELRADVENMTEVISSDGGTIVSDPLRSDNSSYKGMKEKRRGSQEWDLEQCRGVKKS